MVFSDVLDSCKGLSGKNLKKNYMLQKFKEIVFSSAFNGISLGDRYFSFADFVIIKFHYLLFVAIQFFKVQILVEVFFCLWVFWAWLFWVWVIWGRTSSVVYW